MSRQPSLSIGLVPAKSDGKLKASPATESDSEIWTRPFKFGAGQTCLATIFGTKAIERVRLKFSSYEVPHLAVGLRELARFLFLGAYAPSTIFFPGDELVDNLWHSFIVETREYRELCERIRPGSFLDHSGIKYADYLKKKTPDEMHEEQLSWLASYFQCFGPIDEPAFAILNLAQSLAKHSSCGLDELNSLAQSLIRVTSQNAKSTFNYENFLKNEIALNAHLIDQNPIILCGFIRQLAGEAGRSGSELNPFTNSHLESLFGVSAALAFTFWQHLAACERLANHVDWQSKNLNVWNGIRDGQALCGLATTNLAKPGGASLRGIETPDGFLINGEAPWVCGFSIFDYLLVGFETEDSICFATVPFPSRLAQTSVGAIEVVPQKMSCLNGSATVAMKFSAFVVANEFLVSRRFKSDPPVGRTSKYVIPEIGIAQEGILEVSKLVENSKHPRHAIANSMLPILQSRLDNLRLMRSASAPMDELISARDELNRDVVRIWGLALGANAIVKDNPVSRVHLELQLLDIVLQPAVVLQRKIAETAKGRFETI